jgi:hypothetical protein
MFSPEKVQRSVPMTCFVLISSDLNFVSCVKSGPPHQRPSLCRAIAGLPGFLIFSQSVDRPDR